MMRYHIGSLFDLLTDDDYRELGKITDGWTRSDIETLATNIRSFFQAKQNKATHFRYCEMRKRTIVYCAPSDNENVTKASAHDFHPKQLGNPSFHLNTVLKHSEKSETSGHT
jgi:hypothetical protein